MDADALEHYKRGLTLYGQKKYDEAVLAFDAALELQADWNDCLQAKGMAQMHGGLLKEALQTLTRFTELAPEDPQGFTSLSMVWVRLENIEEAEKAQAQARLLSWKQELKENPNAPPPPDAGSMPVQQ